MAAGEILAFLDDDAVADPLWLATAVAWLDEHPETLAVGGPDPAPPDSTVAELISDTLLATPGIGSGVPPTRPPRILVRTQRRRS